MTSHNGFSSPEGEGEGKAAEQTRDNGLLVGAAMAFALWLASIGPVRTWASSAGFRGHWAVGVAPSFFAGFTFALWQAFATRSRPLVAAAYGLALVTMTEVAQLVLPRYTADVWDVVAGAIGAALAVPVLLWRARRRDARDAKHAT